MIRKKKKGGGRAVRELEQINALLPAWYAANARDLPWRKNADPYRVWLSEIMLQQTRAEAVIPYYERFLLEVPDAAALAALPEEKLLKLWEGLGYYSRARNLKKCAGILLRDFGGAFPPDIEKLRSLPGIGPYTAGAIGSICFGLPTPAVDGNVLRVYARLTADGEPSDTDAFRKKVTAALTPVYETGSPALLTQSLMELGACVCVPNGRPKCESCPMESVCKAHERGEETAYPVKRPKARRRIVTKAVLVADCAGRYPIQKRPETGLLAGLWEFPSLDLPDGSEATPSGAADFAASLGLKVKELEKTVDYTHVFTHVEWRMRCFYFRCDNKDAHLVFTSREELESVYALPSAMRPFLEGIAEGREASVCG